MTINNCTYVSEKFIKEKYEYRPASKKRNCIRKYVTEE